MSLLKERKSPPSPPRLEGKEVLVGKDPSVAKVKGVMFGGRKQFLVDTMGEERFAKFIETLTPRTRGYVKTPLASSWCEFESLIELDRAIHHELKSEYPNVLALIGAASAELGVGRVYRSLDSESLKAKHPNVLALIGAASAELGIGRVYRSLDSAELTQFLENNAQFHNQYQKFGRVKFEKTPTGARMVYTDYPCYSPIFCASAIGFFLESILRHGGTDPTVKETRCQTLGEPSCTYEMTWS